MLDAVKNYLNLASGLTEVTRQRAVAAAKALQASGEATAEQVQNLADELLVNSRNNRDALLALVRYEVDRALNRLGLATADEMASLQRRVTSLEGALSLASGEVAKATKAPAKSTAAKATKAPAKSTAAKATKAPAKSTAAKSTAAKSTAAKTAAKTAAATSPAKATAAKATAARSTAAKSTGAAKATSSARKAPAKKAAGAAPTTS